MSDLSERSEFVADASVYRLTAIAYWESAKVLQKAIEDKGEKVPGNRAAIPYYLLISHAIELFLKCALLKRGVSPEALKKYEFRHDLKTLLEAIEAFKVAITARTREVVMVISPQHKDHVLRYSVFRWDSGPVYVPEPAEIDAVLEELLMIGRISTHGV